MSYWEGIVDVNSVAKTATKWTINTEDFISCTVQNFILWTSSCNSTSEITKTLLWPYLTLRVFNTMNTEISLLSSICVQTSQSLHITNKVVEMDELYHLLRNKADNIAGRCLYRHFLQTTGNTRTATCTGAKYRSCKLYHFLFNAIVSSHTKHPRTAIAALKWHWLYDRIK